MSIYKIIQNMRNSQNNIRLDDYIKVVEWLGYSLARQKGSHMIYKKKNCNPITIVNNNPVKAIYVRQLLFIIDEKE